MRHSPAGLAKMRERMSWSGSPGPRWPSAAWTPTHLYPPNLQVGQLRVEPVAGRPLLDAFEKSRVARPSLDRRHIERVGNRPRGALDIEGRDQQRAVGGVA